MVVSTDVERRDDLVRRWSQSHEVVVGVTPLEVITRLEAEGTLISTVVLAGTSGSANDRELAGFIDAMYPWVRLIFAHDERGDRHADVAYDLVTA